MTIDHEREIGIVHEINTMYDELDFNLISDFHGISNHIYNSIISLIKITILKNQMNFKMANECEFPELMNDDQLTHLYPNSGYFNGEPICEFLNLIKLKYLIHRVMFNQRKRGERMNFIRGFRMVMGNGKVAVIIIGITNLFETRVNEYKPFHNNKFPVNDILFNNSNGVAFEVESIKFNEYGNNLWQFTKFKNIFNEGDELLNKMGDCIGKITSIFDDCNMPFKNSIIQPVFSTPNLGEIKLNLIKVKNEEVDCFRDVGRVIQFTSGSGDGERDGECAICREGYGQSSQFAMMLINCQHIYHIECITNWIRVSKDGKCPLCRL